MRHGGVFLLLAAGCGTSTAPAPEDQEPWVWVERYAERLRQAPEDVDALRGLALHLIECDAGVMATMREFHGVGEAMMRHNYPSHLWIHPFVRGCLLFQQGREEAAREEFRTAAEAAAEAGDGPVRRVVREQSLRRLAASR